MRKLLVLGVLLGLSSPAVAQAPSQWYVCLHVTPKGKPMKTNVCTASKDVAYNTATARFTKALYKGRMVAEIEYCRPTHEACVE